MPTTASPAPRLSRKRKGAITAALYDTDEARILRAADAFAAAGVNLSVNLTGNIFVNQSAAFSDFHVTGLNPAGNASLTDAAFVAGRFAPRDVAPSGRRLNHQPSERTQGEETQ